MQLTLKTDYSLRLLLYLALHPGRTVPVKQVAESFGISGHHLTKVAQRLADLGFVELVRGRRGGVRLLRAPDSVSLAEVVQSVEGSLALVECFDPATNSCVIAPGCTLKHVLKEAQNAFFKVLNGYTLADIIRNPAALLRFLSLKTSPPQFGK